MPPDCQCRASDIGSLHEHCHSDVIGNLGDQVRSVDDNFKIIALRQDGNGCFACKKSSEHFRLCQGAYFGRDEFVQAKITLHPGAVLGAQQHHTAAILTTDIAASAPSPASHIVNET